MKMMVFLIHFPTILFCMETFPFDMTDCKEILYFFLNTPGESLEFMVSEKNSKWVTVGWKQY